MCVCVCVCVCNGKLCKPKCYIPFEMIAWWDSLGAIPVSSTLIHHFAMQDAISVIVSIKQCERIKQTPHHRKLGPHSSFARGDVNKTRGGSRCPVGGAPTLREAPTYDFAKFSLEKCMPLRNFRPLEGGGTPGAPLWIRHWKPCKVVATKPR